MLINPFLVEIAQVARPKHGKQEIHAVDTEKGDEMDKYCRSKCSNPYVVHRFNEYPTDNIAEKNAFQEPHGIHEPHPADVNNFWIRVKSRKGDEEVH